MILVYSYLLAALVHLVVFITVERVFTIPHIISQVFTSLFWPAYAYMVALDHKQMSQSELFDQPESQTEWVERESFDD